MVFYVILGRSKNAQEESPWAAAHFEQVGVGIELHSGDKDLGNTTLPQIPRWDTVSIGAGKSDNGEVALLYDNHWPKRDHVREGTKERPYRFVSVEELLKDFFVHVEKIERSGR
jgi:hypothetical protein